MTAKTQARTRTRTLSTGSGKTASILAYMSRRIYLMRTVSDAKKLVARVEHGYAVMLASVSPEAAKYLLDNHNTANRTINRRNSEMLAAALERGAWQLTTEAIGLTREGELIQGQHRLTAIVRSNTPALLVVLVGIDPEVKFVVDTGKPRTLADALVMSGIQKSAGNMASVLSSHYGYHHSDRRLQNMQKGNGYAFDYPLAIGWLQSHSDTITLENLNKANALHKRLVKEYQQDGWAETFRVPWAGIATAYMLTLSVNDTDARQFMNDLFTPDSLSNRDPVNTLRNHWLQPNAEGSRKEQVMAAYLSAWNARRTRDSINRKQLVFRMEDVMPTAK